MATLAVSGIIDGLHQSPLGVRHVAIGTLKLFQPHFRPALQRAPALVQDRDAAFFEMHLVVEADHSGIARAVGSLEKRWMIAVEPGNCSSERTGLVTRLETGVTGRAVPVFDLCQQWMTTMLTMAARARWCSQLLLMVNWAVMAL